MVTCDLSIDHDDGLPRISRVYEVNGFPDWEFHSTLPYYLQYNRTLAARVVRWCVTSHTECHGAQYSLARRAGTFPRTTEDDSSVTVDPPD